MIFRLAVLLTLVATIGVLVVPGQQSRETDRDGRELRGPVRSVKIVPEVLEAADKNDCSEGWIPSEITFDKYGNIETDVQFGREGEIVERTTTEIDKSGNKVKESHFDARGELRFAFLFEYDRKGNIVEIKHVNADGKVIGHSRSEFDKQGRSESNVSYNNDGTINTTTDVTYDTSGERVGEISSTPEGGVVSRVEYKRSKEKGVEKVETLLYNGDGTPNFHIIETTEKNGDHQHEQLDADGKLVEKQRWEYQKKDSRGNWTVEIMTKWVARDGELTLRIKKKTTRTIEYF